MTDASADDPRALARDYCLARPPVLERAARFLDSRYGLEPTRQRRLQEASASEARGDPEHVTSRLRADAADLTLHECLRLAAVDLSGDIPGDPRCDLPASKRLTAAGPESLGALIIITWLCYDCDADTRLPRFCEFQALPWNHIGGQLGLGRMWLAQALLTPTWMELVKEAIGRLGPDLKQPMAGAQAPGSHATPALVTTPLAKLHDQLDSFLVTAGMFRREMHRLEQADAAGELSGGVRRGWFPDRGCRIHPAESEAIRAERHRDPVIKSIALNRTLQRCGHEVFKHLPAAVAWLDDRDAAAQNRWTARVDADVRELLGCPYRGQPNDVELSDLPWPDQGIVDAMWPVMERLERLLHELKSVERTRAAPIAAPVGITQMYQGDLDEAEIAAVLQLGERDIWGVDELPETIDADMLRCLDRHGFVQARSVIMQNQQKYPGDTTPPRPSPGVWFSPIKQPTRAGDWDAVVTGHLRDSRCHPSQIRLTDVGKAERAKIQRSRAKVAPLDEERALRSVIRLASTGADAAGCDVALPNGSRPTDLEHLEGWAKRLQAWCEGGEPANRHLWIIFRPDEMTADAMMRLSIKFPLVMRQVHDTLDFVEKHFDPMKAGDPAAIDSFNGGLFSLMERIRAAVATIRASENEEEEGEEGPGEGTSDAEADTPAETDWEVVQGLLLAKCDRGEAYTSLRKLAAEFHCSDGTIRKAIKASETLTGWYKGGSGDRDDQAAPKAESLTDINMEKAIQNREAAPADLLTDEDIDAAMAKLLHHASPDERAELNTKTRDEQRELARVYYEQEADREPSPLDGRRQRVRHFKRA